MEVVILESAYKHGISQESIKYCLLHFYNDLILDAYLHKRLLVGFDHAGNALEIIIVEDFEQSRILVIHAMKLRKQFYFLLEDN
jgi:hypothetical protein